MFSTRVNNNLSTANTLTYVNTTNATGVFGTAAITLTINASVQQGDIMVMFNHATSAASGTTVPTLTTPTGWTLINTSASTSQTNAIRSSCFYKIASSTDANSTLTGMANPNSSGQNVMSAMYWRPNSPSGRVTVGNLNSEFNNAVPTSQTLTLTGFNGASLGFSYWAYSTSGNTGSSTTAQTRTVALASGASTYARVMSFENLNTAGLSNSTISMADFGSNNMASFTLLVT